MKRNLLIGSTLTALLLELLADERDGTARNGSVADDADGLEVGEAGSELLERPEVVEVAESIGRDQRPRL